MMCYGSTGWVRENFQAKADKHNEVGGHLVRPSGFPSPSLQNVVQSFNVGSAALP